MICYKHKSSSASPAQISSSVSKAISARTKLVLALRDMSQVDIDPDTCCIECDKKKLIDVISELSSIISKHSLQRS